VGSVRPKACHSSRKDSPSQAKRYLGLVGAPFFHECILPDSIHIREFCGGHCVVFLIA
jgi:hypothetical protein